MDFREAFDGVICMDTMEQYMSGGLTGRSSQGFREALKPGGVLYFTLDLAEAGEVEAAYERAKGRGLPVVFGEVADEVEAAYERAKALGHAGGVRGAGRRGSVPIINRR